MKTRLLILNAIFTITLCSQSSSIVFESGTTIAVTGSADICANTITINGSYSGDGTQCNSPLPVELISFTSRADGNSVTLTWQTATEVNNYGFDIQRTVISGQHSNEWEIIGFVEGHGNSNSLKEYSFKDVKPIRGKNLYRLKQIDTDGRFEYSNEIEVEITAPTEFLLSQNYPNPFNPSTVISYQLSVPSNVVLKIFDVLGNEIATLIDNEFKEAGYYIYQLRINNYQLTTGVYFYRLQAGEFVQMRKMLLLR